MSQRVKDSKNHADLRRIYTGEIFEESEDRAEVLEVEWGNLSIYTTHGASVEVRSHTNVVEFPVGDDVVWNVANQDGRVVEYIRPSAFATLSQMVNELERLDEQHG